MVYKSYHSNGKSLIIYTPSNNIQHSCNLNGMAEFVKHNKCKYYTTYKDYYGRLRDSFLPMLKDVYKGY